GDPDRGGAEEAQPPRRLLIGDVDEADLGRQPELAGDALDDGKRRPVVGAAVEVEHLDERTGMAFRGRARCGRALGGRGATGLAHGVLLTRGGAAAASRWRINSTNAAARPRVATSAVSAVSAVAPAATAARTVREGWWWPRLSAARPSSRASTTAAAP